MGSPTAPTGLPNGYSWWFVMETPPQKNREACLSPGSELKRPEDRTGGIGGAGLWGGGVRIYSS